MPSKLTKVALVVGSVLGVAMSSMASAQAEVISMPSHEKSFASPIGGDIMVGSRDETINRIAPLNMVGTTREAFVTTTAYGQINAAATGKLKVGYHVGCAVTIGTGTLGATPDLIIPIPLNGPNGPNGPVGPNGPNGNNYPNQPNFPNFPNYPNRPNWPNWPNANWNNGNGGNGNGNNGNGNNGNGNNVNNVPILVNPNPVVTLNLQAGEVAEVELAEKEMIPGKLIQIVVRDFHIKVDTCTGPVTLRQFAYVYATSPEVDDSGAVFGDPTWL
ncbi:MspA family porin [Nocardia sp. NPDC049707]|uniref:MspA family porin n=1 Tax=Nocardia sp. NPDC049707 TaxID=3154735 RepID=UPI0034213202